VARDRYSKVYRYNFNKTTFIVVAVPVGGQAQVVKEYRYFNKTTFVVVATPVVMSCSSLIIDPDDR